MVREREREETRIERVQRLLKWPNARTRRLLTLLHPSEMAQLLEDQPMEWQKQVVSDLPRELVSEAIAEMQAEDRAVRLLTSLHPEVTAALLDELSWDDIADLVALLPAEYQQEVLKHVSPEDQKVLSNLLQYEEDSAGGLMNPELITVQEGMTKLEALRAVVRQSEEMEDFYTIYVVDEEGYLTGYLTFKSLFRAKNNQLVREIMGRDVVSITADMDQEDVAKSMSQYNLPTLPVVDQDGRLLGRITFDDVLDVIQEETTEDILSFAGVSEDEDLRGGWANAVKSRLPWLMINLITASVTSTVVALFGDVISRMVVLATLMPVIGGVAGNSATQTLAVTIRRIATAGIEGKETWRVIQKEMLVGIINGLMIGAVVSLTVALLNPDPNPKLEALLGIVVFMAMCGNLLIAAVAGSFIPITLEKLGVDPAVASSILITSITDVLGYLLLFGLASRLVLPLASKLHDAGVMLMGPVM